jgi:hypothetical protein
MAAALDAGIALGGCHTTEKMEAEVSAVTRTETQPSAAGCGSTGSPDCPLQRWMKATLQAYQRGRDDERLSRAFHELAEHAPEGYADWRMRAEHGAELAAKHDPDAVKQVCKDCHSAHRSRYRTERRAAAIW